MYNTFNLFKNKKINIILVIIFSFIILSFNLTKEDVIIQGNLKQFDLSTEINYKEGFIKPISGLGISNINAMEPTEDGGYIVVGSFSKDIDFNFDKITDAESKGELDGFISKYDSKGTLQWYKCYGDLGNDELLNVDVLENGNYLVSGYISYKNKEGIVAELDQKGNLIWNKVFYNLGDNQVVDAKKLSNGNIAAVMKFNDEMLGMCDGAELPNNFKTLGEKSRDPGRNNAMLVVLNEKRDLKWGNYFYSTKNLDIKNVIETKEGIVIALNYFEKVYFNEKPFTVAETLEQVKNIQILSNGEQDAALIAYSLDGIYKWNFAFGGKKEDQFSNMKIDNDGNIIIAGSYGSNVTIGQDVLPTKSSTCTSSVALKINPNGEYIGNVNFGMSTDFESYNSRLTAIAPTKDGGLLLGGIFYGIIDVDKDGEIDFTSRGQSNYDTLLVKVDKEFIVEWAKNFSGLNHEKITSVAQLKNEEIVAAVNFNSDKIFLADDVDINKAVVSKEGYDDAFVAMYSNDINYQIHYFYDGLEDETKVENLPGKIGKEITEYPDKVTLGYKLDRVEKLPLKLSSNENLNIINIYYVYDPQQKKTINYTVEYYKDNELQIKDTKVVEKEIHVLDEETLKFDKTLVNDSEKYNGYKLEKVEPENIQEKVSNGDVIKVYYVKIPKKIIGYSVEYYIDDQLQENDTINVQKEVLETQSDELEVDLTRINTTNRYTDKEFVRTEPEVIPNVVNNGSVIKVFYKTTKGKINIEYREKETNFKIAEDTYIEKNIGDNYETKPLEIKGYNLIEEPQNSKGIVDLNNIVVTYYYEKNAQVAVSYIELNSGNLIQSNIIEGNKGEYYNIIPIDFDKYALVEKDKDGNNMLPENKEGHMVSGTIEVKFYYEAIPEGVIEKHIDKITGEILENDIYSGNDGEIYQTNEKKFNGYDLQADDNGEFIYPENANGTFENNKLIEVKYYYVRKTKVIVKHIDKITNKEIIVNNEDTSEVIDGHAGDLYKTNSKDFEEYKLYEVPENKSGIMTFRRVNGIDDDTIEVNYYYVPKETTVIVKHIDYKTKEVIELENITGNEGDKYQTVSKVFEGYDLLEKDKDGNNLLPENKEGVIVNGLIKVNYYYIRKANVVVKYIDEDTEKEISDSVIINGHEDDEYTTEAKDLEGYRLSKNPDNANGTMKVVKTEDKLNSTVEVKYYYKKLPPKSTIIVSYIDKNTNIKLDKEEFVVEKGKEYKTESKFFEGYDLLEKDINGNSLLPENANGVADCSKVEVNYYYVRKMIIKVQYVDEDTNKLIENELLIGSHEGDSYEVKRKEIKGYDLDSEKLPCNEKGVMKVVKDEEGNDITEVIVKYYYKKIPKKSIITVSYIDKNTDKEIKKEEIEVDFGKEYNIINRDIEGYTLLTKDKDGNSLLPKNAKGEAKEEKINVKFYYACKMKIKVQYIDASSNKEIIESNIIEKNEGESYEVDRKDIKGYKLVVDKIPNNEKGVLKVVKDKDGKEIKEVVVKYYYNKETTPVKPDSKPQPQPQPRPQPKPQPQPKPSNPNIIPNTGDVLPIILISLIVSIIVINILVQVYIVIKDRKNK